MVWFTPVEGLTFQGGVTYTDAKYGRFTAADMSSPGRFPQLSLLPGARASFAPEWSLTGALAFDRSLGGGLRGGFNLSAKYSTDYNTGSDLLPYKHQDAFTVVNGRVSIGSEDERWTVEVWGQNLLQEEYTQVGFAARCRARPSPTRRRPRRTAPITTRPPTRRPITPTSAPRAPMGDAEGQILIVRPQD